MKTITIEYIPALGSFLDEEEVYFKTEKGNEKITITYNTPEQLFLLGVKFGEWKENLPA